MKKVLITGAAGFLGQGIVPVLAEENTLRLCDVADDPGLGHEFIKGDVSSLAACREMVEGMDAVVIAHMLCRTDDRTVYEEPEAPFDVNVKGTANLFCAAAEAGIRRIVLVSSGGAVSGHELDYWPADIGVKPGDRDIYCLTKGCQELIAEQYQRRFGLEVAALRIGGIANADDNTTKYGNKPPYFGRELIDRRDIGTAIRQALKVDGLTYETFWIMGPPEADEKYDVAHARKRLDWQPRYDFSDLK